ncbi:uncharacterized [Tachysurus ichikawai]
MFSGPVSDVLSVKGCSPEIRARLLHVFRLFRLGLVKRSRMALFAWRLADFLFPTDCFRVFIVAFSSCPYNGVNFV